MKLKNTLKWSAGMFAVLGLGSTAWGAYVNGIITFSGNAVLDSEVLVDTGVPGDPGFQPAATGVKEWKNTVVNAVNGNLAEHVNAGDAVEFANPWYFNSGVSPFWTVNGFTFDLVSTYIEPTDGNHLHVMGTGLISGYGFTPTPGTWSFTTQEPSVGAQFSFSASSEAVPDGGATLTLLGLSLLGLHAAKRRFGTR